MVIIKFFFATRSGVYNEPNCDKNILGYRAVTVVGYGSLNNSNYWVIFKFGFWISAKFTFLIISFIRLFVILGEDFGAMLVTFSSNGVSTCVKLNPVRLFLPLLVKVLQYLEKICHLLPDSINRLFSQFSVLKNNVTRLPKDFVT